MIEAKYYRWAIYLAVFTIVYNIVEGVLAMYFGLEEDTLTLFGFGADSFVETVSALGIMQMVLRIKKDPDSKKGKSEITALKITGWCFYILVVVLVVSSLINLYKGVQPSSTLPGIIISSLSIVIMWVLIRMKIALGNKLNSPALISDAKCNQVCIYMSVVLLISSGLWMLWEIPYVDIIGTAGIIYFSIREGKEAFEKAKGLHNCAC